MFLLIGSDIWPPVHGIDGCCDSFSVSRFYLMYFPNQSTNNDSFQGYSTGSKLRGAAVLQAVVDLPGRVLQLCVHTRVVFVI